MASTINAAVGGVVITSDSSGALNIQVGGVTAIEIGANQSVTLANVTATTLDLASANITTLTGTNFSATSLTLTNALGIAEGGTGLDSTPTNGQLLIGNGSGFALSTLTAGSGITVTNNAGSITITNSSTGGAQDYIVQSYGIV
jgi:hypothetical protein